MPSKTQILRSSFESSSASFGYLLGGVPPGYPDGWLVDGPQQIPLLPRLTQARLPTDLVAFNDRGRAGNPRETAIHFFKHDHKFKGVLADPPAYVANFLDFGFILTPDLTILQNMPQWQIAQNIWLARAVGAVFSSRGFDVIPTVRWNTQKDYEICCAGIHKDSIIAVSSYGSIRDKALKYEFEKGIDHVAGRLKPHTILLHGSWLPEFSALQRSGITVINPKPERHWKRPGIQGIKTREELQTPLFDL